MKILLIEDLPIGKFFQQVIRDFLPMGTEVIWVKHMDGFFRHLDLLEDIHTFDAIVCDHNFPSCPEERPKEHGTDLFYELFSEGYKGKFIHFSAQPCPEKYDLKDNLNSKMKFYSLKKSEDGATGLALVEILK